jgi:hypothetical protein
MMSLAKITELCVEHPEYPADSSTHECLPSEMKCAYCARRLAPYPCHGCGKFMTAKEMFGARSGDRSNRCEECEP